MNMKTIMITGASKGIGRQTALTLSQPDTSFETIVVLGRQMDLLEDLVAEAQQISTDKKIIPIVADLENPDVVHDVFKELDQKGVRLNAIVNNAGFTKPALLNDTHQDDFETTMRVNLYSPFRIIQTALREDHPLEQIINIASTAGINGRAGWLSYSASKAAMINMSEVLREELKPEGIEVTCLSPGRCATDLRKTLAPDEDPSTIMQPEQVAGVIKLMTSDLGKLLHSINLVVRT